MFLSKASNGNYYVYYTKSDGKKTRISTKSKKKSEAIRFVSEFEKNIKVRQISDTVQSFLQNLDGSIQNTPKLITQRIQHIRFR